MIRIIADTTCALPRETTRKLNIPMLPQIIIFGEETYRDDSELDTAGFLTKLRASPVLPKTAAPPPALYAPVFKELLDQGDTILAVCPSAEVSGTLRSVQVAAQDFPGAPIHIVDMRTIAGMLGAAVLLADRWAKQGLGIEEILAKLETLKNRQRTYFVVDTLEYLHKGGRIGGASRLVGEVLQVKPILHILDGRVEAFEKQRTRKRALARLAELVAEECPKGNDSFLCVMQADAQGAAEELAGGLRRQTGAQEIPIYELPPAIVTHGGPGTLAVGFYVQPVT
ncbi:MAG: DegV family protein [Anaerolineales bacterium]|nr:DegV family protein [Anaerolineales bacterium]